MADALRLAAAAPVEVLLASQKDQAYCEQLAEQAQQKDALAASEAKTKGVAAEVVDALREELSKAQAEAKESHAWAETERETVAAGAATFVTDRGDDIILQPEQPSGLRSRSP